MPRKFTLALCSFTLCLTLCAAARAQSDTGKVEVGGQFSIINVKNGRATLQSPGGTFTVYERGKEAGFGGRVGYNFNRCFSVEAETDFFPRERALTDTDFDGGRKWQGLFGVKAGRRFNKVGVFAKARPGFVHFSEGELQMNGSCQIFIGPPPLACFNATGRTDFAFDVGGVVEFYPSAHAFIRFDAGDTILHTGAHLVPSPAKQSLNSPVFFATAAAPAATTHNFQTSVGFGFRF